MANEFPTIVDGNFARTIADEAQRPEVTEIGDRPFLLLPHRYIAQDLEKILPRPQRKAGTVFVDDEKSFGEYVRKHATPGVSTIYCNADFAEGSVKLVAVLNDHGTTDAGWKDHRVVYPVPNSEEWKRWTGSNGKPFTQAEFAQFIEDNQRDIASADGMPTGVDMLQMALSMEINQDARFKSSVRLQSGGVELALVNQEDDATLTRMKVFERFALGIAPIWNGDPYQLIARLRYRASEGKLRFWYELVRPDLVVQDAVLTMATRIAAETDISVLMGRAE